MANRFMRAFDGTRKRIPESFYVSVSHSTTDVLVDKNVFIATVPCEVVSVREVHSAGGAGSSTLDVEKTTGTTAAGSGTTVLSAVFALDSTNETVVSKTAASGLTATLADRKLVAGDRLCFDVSGTVTAYVGTVVIELKQLDTVGGPV